MKTRPPLWQAAAAVACFWAAVDSVARWVIVYVRAPIHEDARMIYVASEAGVRYGWSRIYDQSLLRSLSASFPPDQRHIDNVYTYLHPPLVAWLFAPLTIFSEPVAYGLWTLASAIALVAAWKVAAPFSGLPKASLLLLAFGLYPVLLAFYFAQPTILVIAGVAASWWFAKKDQTLAAGFALALATFLKPQVVVLLPVALLLSGRVRLFAFWAAGCAVLGAVTLLVIGESGVVSWVQAVSAGEGDPVHTVYTLAGVLGGGPLTYALWILEGAIALVVARLRRAETDVVFAIGILGSAATAFHFHELDYSGLVLAAWFVLRTFPPLWHRLFLVAGIVPMELMIFGPDLTQGAWDLVWHAPILVWNAVWLLVLLAGAFAAPQLKPATAVATVPAGVRS